MSSKKHSAELRELCKHRVAASVTEDAVFNLLKGLDCPRSLTVWLLYTYGEHDQLVDLECNPTDYDDQYHFRDSYTATNFLSKATFLRTSFDRKVKALDKFVLFEERCRVTNDRFRDLSLDTLFKGSSVWLLNATQRKVTEILGGFSPDEWVEACDWGPGSTVLLRGQEVSAFNKFHDERGITHKLYSLVSPWFGVVYPGWAQDFASTGKPFHKAVVPTSGNRVITVPKNAKTERVIAIEPGLNLWFQKGLGSMIRRRLKRSGVDLNSQDRNQRLSRLGSLTGHLATVDFSSASDSIAYEVVRQLLPEDWFTVLDCCRSPSGDYEGSIYEWEKFSSMGNGFTFELESLIFYAAALAVCEYLELDGKWVSVFGDDVILPTPAYQLFSEFAKFLGFQVNSQKSFWDGWFRESCGSHYYRGLDCKPIYLREVIQDVPSIYKLANGVRMLAHRRNSHYGCDSKLLRCWVDLYKRTPSRLRFRVPAGYGDGGFVSNFDELSPSVVRRAPHGFEGFLFRAVTDTGVSRVADGLALLWTRVRQVRGVPVGRQWLRDVASDRAYLDEYTLRGRTRRRLVWSLAPQWYNLGPWL